MNHQQQEPSLLFVLNPENKVLEIGTVFLRNGGTRVWHMVLVREPAAFCSVNPKAWLLFLYQLRWTIVYHRQYRICEYTKMYAIKIDLKDESKGNLTK